MGAVLEEFDSFLRAHGMDFVHLCDLPPHVAHDEVVAARVVHLLCEVLEVHAELVVALDVHRFAARVDNRRRHRRERKAVRQNFIPRLGAGAEQTQKDRRPAGVEAQGELVPRVLGDLLFDLRDLRLLRRVQVVAEQLSGRHAPHGGLDALRGNRVRHLDRLLQRRPSSLRRQSREEVRQALGWCRGGLVDSGPQRHRRRRRQGNHAS
mmetsp:Transcript_21723/g.69947  ORF Transcript_21723/g.69947 Transcript_21723/m.69947 type:complete len:208 (+) Transcript_21723:1198-1821(+)